MHMHAVARADLDFAVAPVSVFDESLEEDPRVNRLQDSLILWTSICSTKILAKTQLIMFLNKCDLLQKKLKRIRFAEFVPAFGQRPNTTEEVVKRKCHPTSPPFPPKLIQPFRSQG